MINLNKIIYIFLKIKLSPHQYAKRIGVTIGDDCRIATYKWGSEPFLISIGNHVHITNNVQFITHDGGVWVFRKNYPDFDVYGKIFVDDNTYIGNNCTIMPGVSIGKNCVIGCNSVVTKSIPDNSVVAGVPARFIMSIDEYFEKMINKNAGTKKIATNLERNEAIKNLDKKKFIIKNFLKINELL